MHEDHLGEQLPDWIDIGLSRSLERALHHHWPVLCRCRSRILLVDEPISPVHEYLGLYERDDGHLDV